MKLIGLTGKARAGKDTTAQFIGAWAAEQGWSWERVAFADPLKRSAAAALGAPGDAIEACNQLKQDGWFVTVEGPSLRGDVTVAKQRITGREFLQRYGTEAHRDIFGPEFWVEATERRLGRMAGAVNIAVVTDVRFPNEAEMIRRHEGEVWQVVREENPDALSGGLEAHASEAGVPERLIDRVIINDHGLDHLEREVRLACLESL